MANKLTKASRKVRKASKAAMKVVRSSMGMLDEHARKAANMLIDPCNADIGAACYRGDQGYKTRLVAGYTAGAGVGVTCVAVIFSPVQNIFWTLETTGSTITAIPANRGGPGLPFLTANASGVRSLGACISGTTVSSNLNTSGVIFTGILPRAAVSTSTAISCDQLVTLCNRYGRISIDSPMETKWLPAGSDEDYTPVGQDPDNSDSNVIVQVYLGLPAATGVLLRLTNIVEWKPLSSLGIVTESYKGNPSVNTIEHVKAAIAQTKPNFWSNVGATAFSVIRGYATGGVLGAAGAAARSVKNFM